MNGYTGRLIDDHHIFILVYYTDLLAGDWGFVSMYGMGYDVAILDDVVGCYGVAIQHDVPALYGVFLQA